MHLVAFELTFILEIGLHNISPYITIIFLQNKSYLITDPTAISETK